MHTYPTNLPADFRPGFDALRHGGAGAAISVETAGRRFGLRLFSADVGGGGPLGIDTYDTYGGSAALRWPADRAILEALGQARMAMENAIYCTDAARGDELIPYEMALAGPNGDCTGPGWRIVGILPNPAHNYPTDLPTTDRAAFDALRHGGGGAYLTVGRLTLPVGPSVAADGSGPLPMETRSVRDDSAATMIHYRDTLANAIYSTDRARVGTDGTDPRTEFALAFPPHVHLSADKP